MQMTFLHGVWHVVLGDAEAARVLRVEHDLTRKQSERRIERMKKRIGQERLLKAIGV